MPTLELRRRYWVSTAYEGIRLRTFIAGHCSCGRKPLVFQRMEDDCQLHYIGTMVGDVELSVFGF